MAGKRRDDSSPGPSLGPSTWQKTDPMDVEPMEVDPTIPDPVLHVVHTTMTLLLRDGDGTFNNDNDLGSIYLSVCQPLRKFSNFTNVVSEAQFKKNARTKSASAFFDLLREALNGNDLSLWVPVVTHGASPPTMNPVLTAHFSNLRHFSQSGSP